MPTDPRGLRADAPLLDAWLRFQESGPTPFTIPGHKQRTDLVGDVVAGDVPLYAGLDTMKLTTGVLTEAEARAARLWGADFCRFSTGGATHANQAVALAVAVSVAVCLTGSEAVRWTGASGCCRSGAGDGLATTCPEAVGRGPGGVPVRGGDAEIRPPPAFTGVTMTGAEWSAWALPVFAAMSSTVCRRHQRSTSM